MTLARTTPAERNGASLHVTDLAVARGGRVVVAGVSFTLEAGDALVVMGANGAGKSTLLRSLAGLLPAESGTVTLDGGSADLGLTEQVHMVGHRDGLKAALTAAENLRFSALALGGAPGPTPREALEAVRLGAVADLPVGYLSAGQRRRVALARLLVAPRPLWVLDEPATALDEQARALLSAAMARHRGEGGLIVAATHGPLGLEGAGTLHLQ